MPPACRILAAVALCVPLFACASGGGLKVDLDPARAAVAEARESGAPDRSPEAFARADGHLQDAEALAAGGGGKKRDARGAQRSADLAVAEAHCATALSRAAAETSSRVTAATDAAAASSAEADRLSARLRKAEEDQRRLEDKVAALARDLEVTETELIRTKARLKGNETKAEASAAIAEARILVGRLGEDKSQASVLARSEESLAKAEEQLSDGNYGAALFFAAKAQDLVARVKESDAAPAASGGADGQPAPVPSHYVVRALSRLRQSPDLSAPILRRVPEGARLRGDDMRGEWVKVTYHGATGWIHHSLLESAGH